MRNPRIAATLAVPPTQRASWFAGTAKVTDLVWLAWLSGAVWVTWPAMKWEFGYLRKTCPNYFTPFLVLLALSPLLFMAWRWARSRFLPRHEFATLACIPLVICIAYQPTAALVVMVVFSACFATGRRITKALGIETRGAVEDIAVSVAIGLGLGHCVLFVVGVAGGYVWPVFVVLLSIPLLLCSSELGAFYWDLRQIDRAWADDSEPSSSPGALLSASLLILVLLAVGYALLPSTYFDLLNIHLPAARYYAVHHGLAAPEYLPTAYYPQSVETLMTLGYALAGWPAAQLLPGIYFSMSMFMLIRIGRLSGMSRLPSVTGVLFALSIPVLHWTGSAGKNDFGLAMFLFGALVAFLRWRETRQWGWILVGAFFIAMAADVKHIVVFAIPPLLVLYTYAAWQQPSRARALAQVAGVLMVFGLFWHVRAWVATGNPVYPSALAAAVQNAKPDWHPSLLREVIWRYLAIYSLPMGPALPRAEILRICIRLPDGYRPAAVRTGLVADLETAQYGREHRSLSLRCVLVLLGCFGGYDPLRDWSVCHCLPVHGLVGSGVFPLTVRG